MSRWAGNWVVIVPNWNLTEINHHDGRVGIAGYAVMDALGVRLGYVSGLVEDGDGRIAMLKAAVTEWSGESEYLIPIGSITLITDERSQIQLRDVTKSDLSRTCLRFTGELPDPRILKSLTRSFPPPRVSVLERLESPAATANHPLRKAMPSTAGAVGWTKLRELMPPSWTSLAASEE